MPGPIFDSHAHYISPQFEPDLPELLQRLPEQGVVGVCSCATHSGDAVENIRLAEQYDYIWAAVGIHPESLTQEDAPTVRKFRGDWRAELESMKPLFCHPKVVAVGECGLDHHWPIPEEAQRELFEAQLRLAAELDKPVIIHDREAHAETYELLKKYRPRGIVHCYSGSAEDAEWIAAQGMYLGFGGSCTFKGVKRAVKALKAIPLENLLLETDCPYMAPTPVRGRRNDSSYIRYVAEFIAECRETTPEEIYTASARNARRVFGLDNN